MRRLERLLLYVVAFSLAAMLISDGFSSSRASHQGLMATARPVTDASGPERPEPRIVEKPVAVDQALSRPDSIADPRAIRISDSAGHVRIELSVDDAGQPRFLLRRADGEVAVQLSADDQGGAEMTLGSPSASSTKIISDHDGNQRVQLRGALGHSVSLNSDSDGSCEVRLCGADDKVQLSLRRTDDKEAELTIRPLNGGDGGIRLFSRSDGVASLRLSALDGLTGPELGVLEDKTSQIAILGAANKSGPSLIRMPDGVSIISARLPNGNPGASMVVSPDGRSVIAVMDKDGRRSAELRTDEHGIPSIQTHDPDAKPSRPRPKPAEEKQRTDGQASYSPL